MQHLTPEEHAALIEEELNRVDEELASEIISPRLRGSILDEKLPHRFGNRSKRRKLEAQIRKLNAK